MSAHEKPALPDPKEIAKTYAEVAQRASNLITAHTKRQMKKGASAPTDELGIARAFMDMMAQMLASPHKMAQAQMNLVWDYFSLWQHSMLRSMGMEGAPVAAPKKGDNRFLIKVYNGGGGYGFCFRVTDTGGGGAGGWGRATDRRRRAGGRTRG
jgi:hypothetical protein